MSKKYILITGCSDKDFWYQNSEGLILEKDKAIPDEEDWYRVENSVMGYYWVNKKDAIPVTLHYANGFVYAVSNEKALGGAGPDAYWDGESAALGFDEDCFKIVGSNDTILIRNGILELKGTIPTDDTKDAVAQGKDPNYNPDGFHHETGRLEEHGGTDADTLNRSPAVVSEDEKKYSLEDINNCWDAAMDFYFAEKDRFFGGINTTPNKETYIQSLQSK